MRCELCGTTEFNTVVLLPIKRPDGRLDTMACLNCAENSSAYCKKHQRPHLGFSDDDTTACMVCVKEKVDEEKYKENNIRDRLRKNLPEEEFNRLINWATVISSITGNPPATCVLRALVTKSLRFKTSIEEIVTQVIQAKSVDLILPK